MAEGDASQLVDMMNLAMPSTIPTAHQMGVRVVEARRGYAAATVPAEGKTVATTRGLYQLRAHGR